MTIPQNGRDRAQNREPAYDLSQQANNQAATCANCKLSRVSDGKMQGWYNCSYLTSSDYRSPRSGCQFTPSRYVAKSSELSLYGTKVS